MNEELRTLKDLGLTAIETPIDIINFKRDLRREAIKWYKKFNVEFTAVKDSEVYMMKHAKRLWIKHFFNIKEKDLE